MIPTLERLLRERWPTYFPERSMPHRVRLALLSTSREPGGTRVLLAFADHDPLPSLVGKVPRDPNKVQALEHEWQRLNQLHQGAVEELLLSLPRPLERMELHGGVVYLQTALPGRNLKTAIQRGERLLSPAQVEADLHRVSRWLELLQKSPVPEALLPGEGGVQPLVHPLREVLPTLSREGVLTSEQGEALLAAAALLEQAQGGRACWVHGDLWPGNVLIHQERWSFLDWDGLEVGGPFFDRVWFALHYGMLGHARLIGREDLGEGFRRVLFMEHPLSDAVLGQLRATVQGPGLEAGAARDYLAVLMGIEAGRILEGRSRRRAFDLHAATLLREWFGYPERVRL
ncbi:MAG: phosphotransferase family protein [Myxococcota bacterium]